MTKNPKFILPGWKRFYAEAEEAFLEYKLRIVQIMEQLDIESEVVFFSDVYEDKSDVSRVLVLGLFNNFRAKFASQCDRLQANKEERLLCISAWYAICFEKCFTYNGKLLLGLPWIVADEMCQLALFNNKDKHGRASLASQKLKSTYDGNMFSGNATAEHSSKSAPEISHISEDSEWNNVRIESHSKPTAHDNTSVVLHYWNPTIIATRLKLANINTDHLIDIHHQLVVETQLKVTLNLVMKWLDRIKKDIYLDREEDQLIQMTDYSATLKEESSLNSFTEEKLLGAFIMKKLKQINLECARNNQPIESLPTISTLFNEYMMYLFEICNRVNYYICHGKLEEMFLLKYAVFALTFLNKLDSKLDRQFYHQFLSDFERNQKCYILKEIHAQQAQRKGEPVNSFLSVYPLNFSTENVYQKCLDSLFESYLSNNANLVHETARFNLLPTNLKIDLKKVEETFVQKLFFLTGLDNVEFEYTKDQQKKANLLSDHLAASVTSSTTVTNSPNIATVTPASVPKRYQTRQFTQSNRSQATIDGRPSTANNNNQDHDGGLAEMERNQYTVKTTGLVHSIMILRLLFGHPDFFPQICDRFNIIPMNIEKDNETLTTTSTIVSESDI